MPYERNVPDYGEVMTVDEFREAVRAGAFIDYDGFAKPVKMKMDDDTTVYPSKIGDLPEDATHVVWFNK